MRNNFSGNNKTTLDSDSASMGDTPCTSIGVAPSQRPFAAHSRPRFDNDSKEESRSNDTIIGPTGRDDDELNVRVESDFRTQQTSEKHVLLTKELQDVTAQKLERLAQFLTCGLSGLLFCMYAKGILLATPSNNNDTMLPHDVLLLLRLSLLAIPVAYNHHTQGSIYRQCQVFAIATIIISRIRLCRFKERCLVQDNAVVGSTSRVATNELWKAEHEISARFLYLSIVRLQGLWTKTAQYLGSRADFMPDAYVRELSKLQDQAPATEWKVVESSLLKGTKSAQHELVDIAETPLASASIGQVHVARLVRKQSWKGKEQENGDSEIAPEEAELGHYDTKVAVKVQHPHAKRLMTDDFASLKVLTRVWAWLEPDYGFVDALMREWAKEAKNELDFQVEADHLRQAREAIKSMYSNCNPTTGRADEDSSSSLLFTRKGVPFQVQIPEPHDELCSQDVLTMTFCEGCRVDDLVQLVEWNLSREDVMNAVAQTFAHFMYCTPMLHGDPHPGNILIRPGTSVDQHQGFTISILDWGLAKELPENKRLALCQMVYAAATLDFGLLLDSFKLIGINYKREDAGQSMEDMRCFLRDLTPTETARARLERRIQSDLENQRKTNEKVRFESQAYPGEFFFFVRVNELMQGLGSRFDINMEYLETLKPFAERGLRQSYMYELKSEMPASAPEIENDQLQETLQDLFQELKEERSLVGGQVCILDKKGKMQANVVAGSLGGLYSHVPMQENALILGYSATKGITSTLAHIMVEEGYLSYDEPICERVWNAFCPQLPTSAVCRGPHRTTNETVIRWQWKRQVTLRHILNHTAGFGSSLPTNISIEKLASCEQCFAAYEFKSDAPKEMLLPIHEPGAKVEYHFMSFGWLVAGTLCGAYSLRHGGRDDVTFEQVYSSVLKERLGPEIMEAGFRPVGISPSESGESPALSAQTVTEDVRACTIMQQMRDHLTTGAPAPRVDSSASEMIETFRGKEFLLDPRIWNNSIAQTANVPSAGGRFSAVGLAKFYSKLGNGNLISSQALTELTRSENCVQSSTNSLLGVANITDAYETASDQFCMGYQLMQTKRDGNNVYSCVGHGGMGGSIGFWHRPTGLAVGLMLNKADGGLDVTKRILRVVSDYYGM